MRAYRLVTEGSRFDGEFAGDSVAQPFGNRASGSV